MQKLITVSVDTKQLISTPNNPFSINDVESVNELLALGWEIEEWDFLKEDSGDGQILLLVTLNDDMVYDGEEDELEEEFDFEDEDEDDLEDEDDEELADEDDEDEEELGKTGSHK